MRFERCLGWRVSFRDPQDMNAKFKELTFAEPEKIEELVAKTPTPMNLETKQMLSLGMRNGNGAITLTLSSEQLAKLLL